MNMPYHTDYKAYFFEEYNRRVRKNSSYSMRAFARDLDISPPKLNMILSGKTGLSPAAAEKVCAKICQPAEREYFVQLVSSLHSRSKVAKAAALKWIEKNKSDKSAWTIKDEEFSLISDWYSIALIHLIDIGPTQKDYSYYANKLGLKREEVATALEKLTQCGLVKTDTAGNYIVSHKFRKYSSSVKSEELKKYYGQMLDKAKESLSLPLEDRTLSVNVAAISKSNFEYVKNEIDEFRKKISQYLVDNSEKTDSVYALSLQFFPLAQELKSEI